MKQLRRSIAVVGGVAAVAALALTGCSPTTTQSSADGDAGASYNATITPPTTCGEDLVYNQPDPDHIMSTLPQSVQTDLSTYMYVARATPWTTFKSKKDGNWKIGWISVPVNNPWLVNLDAQLHEEFDAAKAAGLVDGDLQVYIQPSTSTSTPEQQAAAITQMVSQGVDGIILFPADGIAEQSAIDAAGEAGVPIVTVSPAPTSKYAINLTSNNQENSYAGTFKLLTEKGVMGNGKTLNTLFVRGVAGVTVEQAYWDMLQADLKPCTGINDLGTVWGGWSPATTKTEVLKFLAAHPEQIDLVLQGGSMQAGVIEAFQQAGRPIPAMTMGGSSGGDLAWWAANTDTFDGYGLMYSGKQMAWASWQILMRTLAGNGPLVNSFNPASVVLTNDDIAQYAEPGTNLEWVGDMAGDKTDWVSPAQLDEYFTTPGSPTDKEK